MKKIIALLLILTLAVSLAACGNGNETAANPSGSASESGKNGKT